MVEYIEVDYNPNETKRRTKGLRLYMVVATIWILLIGSYVVLDFGIFSKDENSQEQTGYEDSEILGLQEEKKYSKFDLNKDGRFDEDDLVYFKIHYVTGEDERLDFNSNGRYKQDIVDFKLFLKEYDRFFGQENYDDRIKESLLKQDEQKKPTPTSKSSPTINSESKKTPTPTSKPTIGVTASSTPRPTSTPTPTPRATNTPTPTPRPTNTPTPRPTNTPTPTPTPTDEPTPTPTDEPTPTPTEEPTPTPTEEPTPTPTPEPEI